MTGNSYLRSVPAVALAAAWLFLAACPASSLCPRIKLVEFGDRRVEVGWTLGVDERDIDDFGGYRIWMREAWHDEEFDLIREFVWGEDDSNASGWWNLPHYYDDSVRVYVNDDVHNGFPYYVSVTAFEAASASEINVACRTQNTVPLDEPGYPKGAPAGNLRTIQAIPNPYRSQADWEYGGQRRVTFVNLPAQATIRIYTAAGTHVCTIPHNEPGSDQAFWYLKNSDGEDVAPGVYIWAVEAGELGSAAGKVMIIK